MKSRQAIKATSNEEFIQVTGTEVVEGGTGGSMDWVNGVLATQSN